MKYALILVAITLILLIPLVSADPTNETASNETENTDWYDSQWGGDTGDDGYTAPVENITEDEGGIYDDMCGTTYCSSGFIVGLCVPAYYFQRRNKRRE